MIRRPPRSTLFPTRRSSDLETDYDYDDSGWQAFEQPSEVNKPITDRFMVVRSEEHTSELQSQSNLVCRLLLEKKKKKTSYLNPPTTMNKSYIRLYAVMCNTG